MIREFGAAVEFDLMDDSLVHVSRMRNALKACTGVIEAEAARSEHGWTLEFIFRHTQPLPHAAIRAIGITQAAVKEMDTLISGMGRLAVYQRTNGSHR